MNTLQNGRVTVVVPVYNRESMIGDCLSSIVNQTYTNLDILVVDDGSTDNTVAVVNDFISRDERIRLVRHEKNSGSMNKAMHDSILQCESEYFTWIGSDDSYISTAIGTLVDLHSRDSAVDYISFDLEMCKEAQSCPYCYNKWPNWDGFVSVNPLIQHSKESFVSAVYNSLCPPVPMNGMWKTDFFKRHNLTWIEYKGNTWSPDTLNALQFFSKGMTMKHFNGAALVKYRIHEGQDTAKGMVTEQIRCDITLIEALFDWFDLDVFLPAKDSAVGKCTAFVETLKKLLISHANRHPSTSKLACALSDLAAHAMLYLWRNRESIAPEKRAELEVFFKEYI